MTPAEISLAIGAGTLTVTMLSTTAIVSYMIGQMREDIAHNSEMLNHKADIADVTAMKETLAEIKGMFTLKLRE